MPDTYRIIAPDQIRGADLRQWHVVECECWQCHHIKVLPHALLKRGRRGELTLAQLHFRCEWCGASGAHTLRVFVLPRNC